MQHMRLPHGTCAYALRSPLLPLWERQQEQKKTPGDAFTRRTA